MQQEAHWWQQGIVYHIYPRSFMDGDGDGVGDLRGIIQQLDYLRWLGVDAIWLSPVFPSPMADFGYDIANYTNIDPLFGTLDDMDLLLKEAHERNLRVMLDYVPNHTSDQHPWFRESRSSRDNPKRDWYLWRDAAPDGGPPNNWLNRFGGTPAWTWDAHTQQYYYHTFLPQQPELNWRNPDLCAAMLDVLRFWYERGVDGFRVDVIHRVIKDAQFRDNPPNPNWYPGMDPYKAVIERYTRNQPEVHGVIRQLRAVTDAYDQRVLIGEVNVPVEELMTYYGQNDELHIPFNFLFVHAPRWDAASARQMIDQYEQLLPEDACPNWVLGNHDQSRFASRVGPAQARIGMLLLLTLRGTPTMYYGDELGMQDVPIPPDRVQDPYERFVPGIGVGRDPQRTPMQWASAPNAAFCPPGVEPWLPLSSNAAESNVATQRADPHSMLSFTRAAIQLRRATPALTHGRYHSLDAPAGLLAYRRATPDSRVLVVLNFGSDATVWTLPEAVQPTRVLLSTHMDHHNAACGRTLHLRSDEGLILALDE